MKIIIYFFLFIIAIEACQTEVDQPKEIGLALCPTNIGREVVYSVDSIVYDDFKQRDDNKPDSFNFQLREVITSKFTDNTGKDAYKIIVYKRMNDSFNWEPYKVVSMNVNLENMQKVEDNIRFLKLSFPVSANKTWNGNIYNSLNPKNYTYSKMYFNGKVGSFILDSLVSVEQENDSNFIEKNLSKEIYASSIGLVYGQYDSINYQGSYNQSTKKYYWKGLLLRKTMLSHKP
jgi:hypothetical protein